MIFVPEEARLTAYNLSLISYRVSGCSVYILSYAFLETHRRLDIFGIGNCFVLFFGNVNLRMQCISDY